jgi:hypothetical protein
MISLIRKSLIQIIYLNQTMIGISSIYIYQRDFLFVHILLINYII